jgi:restriction system protein
MAAKSTPNIPQFHQLIVPTFSALKALGGSGGNNEILDKIIELMNLPDSVVDYPHLGSTTMTELQYRLAWARTYLKKAEVIENSARSVWSITPEYSNKDTFSKEELSAIRRRDNSAELLKKLCTPTPKEKTPHLPEPEIETGCPDEVKSWQAKLSELLHNMNPYGFERLTQRLLRECGFVQVEVTKKSGDGGIDGTGKLKINGIFSFNVAFQCKRYSGSVGASEIRDFRGSLTTNIEKGILITTGTFTKQAKEEASSPGKQQIDLIDGEEFINKIAEFGIGVREVKTYEIDEEFFQKI